MSHARTPPPRPLGSKETLDTLSHWKTTWKTFYKRDESYKYFVRETTTWDPSDINYGQVDEVEGLKRKAADMKEDLLDLLNTLAGYLPHSYLTDKIVSGTKSWAEVWNIIWEHYGVQVTGETLLDFESLNKQTGETHRQFYERLLQHCKQHLAPAGVKAEQISNTVADKMSISLMNMTALQWLRKTNPDLIEIVKTEYSTELRGNTPLADLVPKIAPNIDALLKRYDKGAATNSVTVDAVDTFTVNKTFGRGAPFNSLPRGRGRAPAVRAGGQGGRAAGHGGEFKRAGLFCPGCFYLSQQLGTTIHFRHSPGDCPRKAATVKLLQMEDLEFFQEANEFDDNDMLPGNKEFAHNNKVQNEANILQVMRRYEKADTDYTNANVNCFSLSEADLNVSNPASLQNSIQNTSVSDNMTTIMAITAAINRLQARRSSWKQNGVRKEKSPMVAISLKNTPAVATIDEGSEINCLDESYAVKNNIKFVPTGCQATAAGSTDMQLAGQTEDDVCLDVQGTKEPLSWDLQKMVVVKNLGVDILIGEPGKADNQIVTIPHHKIIKVGDSKKKIILPYWPKKMSLTSKYVVCKALKTQVIYPGEVINFELPAELKTETNVNLMPRRSLAKQTCILPSNIPVKNDGSVEIKNGSDIPILIKKHQHYADIRSCEVSNVQHMKEGNFVKKIYDIGCTDVSYLIPQRNVTEDKSFLDEIIIDPDNQLSSTWKRKFKSTCEEFSDIIRPSPGKYNGYYGRVDNSINFTSVPPPSIRAHLPNYSYEMLRVMGEKMDKLEDWGVLVKPEDIGVVPEFVVPSMLTPKPEKGEWRLVTDFTSLNIHIKKLETVAPTINDAKEKLAKFKYHIELDLSNYYYQGGMKLEDTQYLATPHPFKGLRVYICEPQGLRNASEHAYERLARIYGDLCAEEKITRMADGLYVLGDTLEDLEKKFQRGSTQSKTKWINL